MKPVVAFILIVSFIYVCFGLAPSVVYNTRAEGCFDGVCGSHCSHDGAKIFAGDALNQPGKCRLMTCSKEFNINLSSCPVDRKIS